MFAFGFSLEKLRTFSIGLESDYIETCPGRIMRR